MKRELSPLRQVESMGLCEYAAFFNFNHQQSHNSDFFRVCLCLGLFLCLYLDACVFDGHIACFIRDYIAVFSFTIRLSLFFDIKQFQFRILPFTPIRGVTLLHKGKSHHCLHLYKLGNLDLSGNTHTNTHLVE